MRILSEEQMPAELKDAFFQAKGKANGKDLWVMHICVRAMWMTDIPRWRNRRHVREICERRFNGSNANDGTAELMV